jgi:hypothetical protein
LHFCDLKRIRIHGDYVPSSFAAKGTRVRAIGRQLSFAMRAFVPYPVTVIINIISRHSATILYILHMYYFPIIDNKIVNYKQVDLMLLEVEGGTLRRR